ncbi:MAG: alpha/beta hydrolase [Candidatus Hydrogenedentes bacterium]|nr:alpha/beta hydrolase [Candidatus Hydrogenedentota bacterium]
MRPYLLKAWFTLVDRLARWLVYNRDAPPVADYICDVPYDVIDPRQCCDIAVPEGQPPFPVLIVIHGGGLLSGDKKSYTRICKCFAKAGFLAFNVNYRLGPKYTYPVQFQDAAAAVYWIFAHAGEYGGDCTRLFLAGDSAGAHLACWYVAALFNHDLLKATEVKDTIPHDFLKGILLFYGIYDMETCLRCGYPGMRTTAEVFLGKDPARYAELSQVASPIRHIRPSFPPTFICSATRDKLHAQSADLAAALERAGAPCRTIFFTPEQHPEADHAFLNFHQKSCSQIAMAEALNFLRSLTEAANP